MRTAAAAAAERTEQQTCHGKGGKGREAREEGRDESRPLDQGPEASSHDSSTEKQHGDLIRSTSLRICQPEGED
eukprot:evm.model.NODE_23569_length_22012_cov_24.440624.2